MTSATPADWLQELGGPWPSLALGYRYEVQLGKMLDEKRISGKNLFPYLRNVDVQWGRINTKDLPEMDFVLSDQVKYSLRPGDLLVCEGGEVGRAALWLGTIERTVYFQKALHRLRPYDASQESPRYMFYALQTAAEMNAYGAGGKTTIAHLPAEAFRRIRFPKPPLVIQELVADFLDEQTARIDALIAEKERLLATLDEWSAAELSRICFGTDRLTAATGNSWIPNLPVGWKLMRLKHLILGIEQGWSPECEARLAADDEWGVLKAGAANGGRFRETEHKALPATLDPNPELEVRAGDVLVTRASGSADLVGSFAFVYSTRAKLMLSDKNFRLRFNEKPVLLPELLAWMCNTRAVREQVLQYVSGADGLAKNIGSGNLRELWLAVPPETEQPALVEQLHATRRGLEGLQDHLVSHIERLREYRASLISAAVTGQLDINSYKEAA